MEEWAAIRARTSQPLEACSPKPAPFGQTHTVLEHVTTEAEFKDKILDNCMPWIKQQLFEILCPLLAYCPEQALKSVTQNYTGQQWQ